MNFDLVSYEPSFRLSVRPESPMERRVIRRIAHEAYFFNKVVAENIDEFECINVRIEIFRMVQEKYKEIMEKLKNKMGETLPTLNIGSLLPPFERSVGIPYFEIPNVTYYFHKRSPSLIIPISSTAFCVISQTEDGVRKLVEYFRSGFYELSGITKDFGLELRGFWSGKEYQEQIVRKISGYKRHDFKEPKNDLERKIVKSCEGITKSFLSNVNLFFEEPTEDFECDVFIGFTDRAKLIVEGTDYQHLESQLAGETLKSKIILDTLDKARRIGAKSIVICKGFTKSTIDEIKKLADSRGVILLDEENYGSYFGGHILDNLSSELSR